MADSKTSALTAVVTPAGTDEFPVNQGGTSKKETLAQIKTFVETTLLAPGQGAAAANSVQIGSGASANDGTGFFIGAVAIGKDSSSTSAGTVAVGNSASASGVNAVAVGRSSAASGSVSTAVGYSATAAHTSAAAFGALATSTAANQLVIGSEAYTVTDGYIGGGVTAASPTSMAINATGGSGSNVAGGSMTIAGGKGTGSAAGGAVIFKTSDAGASGSTLQSLTEKCRVPVEGGFQLTGNGTKPTAGSAYRGMFWYTPGGAGVADTLEFCAKDNTDTYSWVVLA